MSWDLVGDDEYREYQEARAEEAELEHARRPLVDVEVAARAIGSLHAFSDPMVVSRKVIKAVVDAGFYVRRDDVERALHYLQSNDSADIDAGIEILALTLARSEKHRA